MKKLYLLVLALALGAVMPQNLDAKRKKNKGVDIESMAKPVKAEFRGAWIQTAWQDRYQRMTPDQCKAYLTSLVDLLHSTGFNAVIFQVRPEGDAFYDSMYEPWSRFLTGKQGRLPEPLWDPMAFMINLCHERQMEFHAWINPYRMSASKTLKMDDHHLYYKHPEWFVRFDDKFYLNPGLPESRAYIRAVVKDIVTRYDIDALHMDDYFYPYPVNGKLFDDAAAFSTYAPALNIDTTQPDALANFRRRNVDILIKSVHDDIQSEKPWVRFGISPFGIYRNKGAWEGGSETRGTQCYEDLYADVLLWANSGWIDYLIPQVYWEIGHSLADYSTLVQWWSDNVPSSCQLYIGQSIERSLDGAANSAKTPTLDQSHANFTAKLRQAREAQNVKGNCYWYAYQVEDNQYRVRDFLKSDVFQYPALLPAFDNLDAKAPEKVKKIDGTLANRQLTLTWTPAATDDYAQKPKHYNIYRFAKGEKVRIDDCTHLIGQSCEPRYTDATIQLPNTYTYVVTAVDVFNNESKGVKKAFKLKIKKHKK